MSDTIDNNSSKAPRILSDALAALDRLDADFCDARAQWGNPPDRFEKAGFPALVRIIIGQQISRAVAQTLWARMAAQQWETAQALAPLDYPDLQALGLSRRNRNISSILPVQKRWQAGSQSTSRTASRYLYQNPDRLSRIGAGRSAITGYFVSGSGCGRK